MNGLLIVNHFVDSEKFGELYSLLLASAKRLRISLSVKKTGDIPHNLAAVRDIRTDFVLFWDKDVLLAEMLETCGIPVFNSADAIYRCDNKAYTALALQKAGIPTPETYVAPLTFEGLGYCKTDFADGIAAKLGYPLIVKELFGSFGQQVYLVGSEEELHRLIGSFGCKGFLMQKWIDSSFGRDVRINVVGDRVVCAMLRHNEHGDFRSNISNGGSMKSYDPSEEQMTAATAAVKALGLDFAGVDVMFGRDGAPLICEVNSNPHFKSSLLCTGVDMSYEILYYIREKMKKHDRMADLR